MIGSWDSLITSGFDGVLAGRITRHSPFSAVSRSRRRRGSFGEIFAIQGKETEPRRDLHPACGRLPGRAGELTLLRADQIRAAAWPAFPAKIYHRHDRHTFARSPGARSADWIGSVGPRAKPPRPRRRRALAEGQPRLACRSSGSRSRPTGAPAFLIPNWSIARTSAKAVECGSASSSVRRR